MALAVASPDMPSTAATTATETTTETTTATKISSTEEFTAYLSDPRFNRIFQLPADPSRCRPKSLQVSYADYGFHREAAGGDNGEEQVLLFFGPLMSSRFLNAAKDALAKRYKVRIVSAERPGVGKTDVLPADKRLEVWRRKSSKSDIPRI
jgi:hypothetical protein